MSTPTSTDSGNAPLNDVDMDDLSDITRALPVETASHELKYVLDDTDAMDGVTQALPAETRASDADEASEDMTDIANATSADPNASPQQSDRATHDDKAARLRLEQFERLFAGQTVELKNFARPPQCVQHPEQAEDIFGAYLDQSTFTVKIWVNFDAAEEVFFEGARAAGCGKLQIPKAKLDHLLRLDTKEINFCRVRLDIGTPFRTLAKISLRVYDKDGKAALKVKGEMLEQRPPCDLDDLRDFLVECGRRIESQGIDQNLDMEDLIGIARLFHRQRETRDRANEWEQPKYGGGEWVGMKEPPIRYTSSWFR